MAVTILLYFLCFSLFLAPPTGCVLLSGDGGYGSVYNCDARQVGQLSGAAPIPMRHDPLPSERQLMIAGAAPGGFLAELESSPLVMAASVVVLLIVFYAGVVQPWLARRGGHK